VNYLVVGLGNIGRKRQALLGERCAATVDPFNAEADFAAPEDCPLDRYQAVVLAVPNQSKLSLLEWFIERGKHVLVEKPLVLPDMDIAGHLSQLAATHRAVWYTSYNHRFETLIERMRLHLDSGRIGDVYYARLLYGNGTVANVLDTWRDQGLGVLEDLGSHLLDLAAGLLDCRGCDFRPWSLERHEAHSFDHCVLGSEDSRVMLEMSYLCWKNTFTIDIYGSRGSLHLDGLQKWGPAKLVLRERVFPSGVPEETCEEAPGGVDPTWQRDLEHFDRLCAATDPTTSMRNDLWISQTLAQVAGE
jgi:predicted dehydrogenase